MIDEPALAARVAHHVGEMAGAGDGEGRRIDGAQHVEIDKAVVERRDQRIGHRVRQPHQIAVVAGRIDDDEIMGVLDRVDGGGEVVELGRLVVGDERAIRARDAIMRRHFELEAGVLGPGAAVVDVVREALLARVEIDGGDALAGFQQRDRDMHRDRGLARAAFFVAEYDAIGRARPHASLNRHGHPSRNQAFDCPACRQA